MASKQVTDRQKAASAVYATVETYGDRLLAGMKATLSKAGQSPEAAGAAMSLAKASGSTLMSTIAMLVTADDVHSVELSDDAGLRDTRDTGAGALHVALVDLRDGLGGLYGAGTPRAVGFVGPTPDDPVVLVRVAREVAQGLRKDKVLPPPRFPTAAIDVKAEAARLEDLATKLEAAIAAVVADARENQVTLTARDAAMSGHDKTFSRTANLLSAMFAFAGEPELADRVRPSGRRPGRLASEEEGEEPDEGDGSVGSGAGES